jgi:ABC-type transport system, involved in lipoprotein release, permease component
MIRHIFKIIWNERKTNSWIVLEYILVFCILWFCCDYLYYIGKSYYEPLGFDISNTYFIQMENDYIESGKLTNDERYSHSLTFMERVKQYPGVENVSLSNASMPYSNGVAGSSYFINSDTTAQNFRIRRVSSEFFDVFRIKLTKGKTFDPTDPFSQNHAIISSDRNGYFGDPKNTIYPVYEVDSLVIGSNNNLSSIIVIGVTEKLKSKFYEPYAYTVFLPLHKGAFHLGGEITIRVNPNAAKGFEKRFKNDMKDRLSIGPYAFSDITSVKKLQNEFAKRVGITNNLNSVYSITSFLIINIFLGIIGTFWYRTESRKSEVGLRIALGSSKRKIKTLLYTETIFLLLISAFIGVNICINIGQTDLLTALGIPKANHSNIGSGIEQYFINFGLTFLFLAIISLLAVWYPTRQSSNMHPAEALHEE